MEIKITKICLKDIKAGELFIPIDQQNIFPQKMSGAKLSATVMIRSVTPCPTENEFDKYLKVEIISGDLPKPTTAQETYEFWRSYLEETILLSDDADLNDWERDFLESVEKQMEEKHFLTDAQKEKLEQIREKIE